MPHIHPNREASLPEITLRDHVTPDDCHAIRRIVGATGFFRSDEIDVAVELADERLAKGSHSGYEFLFAERQGEVLGYVCYGPIACTLGSFDLYWVAVDPAQQAQGIGRLLLAEAEQQIRNAGGRHVYIETSGRAQYAPTRKFYAACGYQIVATLPDFYEPDDDKVIWRQKF